MITSTLTNRTPFTTLRTDKNGTYRTRVATMTLANAIDTATAAAKAILADCSQDLAAEHVRACGRPVGPRP